MTSQRRFARRLAVALCLASGLAPALAGSLYHVDAAGQRLEVVAGRLVRTYPNGAVDAQFGGPRGVLLAAGAAAVTPTALVLDPQGRVLLAGVRQGMNGAPAGAVVLRLRSDGTLDPTWGEAGVASQGPTAEPYEVADLAPLADGGVAVLANAGAMPMRPGLWKLDARGRLDEREAPLAWSGPPARALGLATAGVARVMVAVELTAGEREQQLHGWATADDKALPELVARQVLPPDFRTPVPRLDGKRWVWVEGEQDSGEMANVQFTARGAAPSAPAWVRGVPAAAVAQAAAPEPPTEGHAAFSPFAGAASAPAQAPPQAASDDHTGAYVLGALVLAVLAAALAWWRRAGRALAREERSPYLAKGAR